LPAHGGKRHVMSPGGQSMAENDTSWPQRIPLR